MKRKQIASGCFQNIDLENFEVPQKNLEAMLGKPPTVRYRSVNAPIERGGDEEIAFMLKNAAHLLHCPERIKRMFKDFHAYDAVVSFVGNRVVAFSEVANVRWLVCIDDVKSLMGGIPKKLPYDGTVLRANLEQSTGARRQILRGPLKKPRDMFSGQ